MVLDLQLAELHVSSNLRPFCSPPDMPLDVLKAKNKLSSSFGPRYVTTINFSLGCQFFMADPWTVYRLLTIASGPCANVRQQKCCECKVLPLAVLAATAAMEGASVI